MKLDKWTVILIIALVIIGIIVYIGIQNKWFLPKNPLELKDGDGSVRTDSNGNVSNEYTRIAQFAHDNVRGWNLNLTDGAFWAQLAKQLYPLNNNELRQVVNEYERMYTPDSLRTVVTGETTGCWDKSWYSSTDPCYQWQEIIDRLNNLNA